MVGRQFVIHWQSTLKVLICLAVLSYLSWTYRRNVLLFFSFVSNPEHRACVYRRRDYELQERSSPLYVTLSRHGRLGNWLFGYASLLGIARANGYIPYFPNHHPLGSYFDLKHVRHQHAECLLTVYDNLPCSYVPSMMVLPQGNISIDGYIQSWKYFRFMESEVRKELKMNQKLLQDSRMVFKELLGSYIAEKRLVISVHVRRGDVLKPEARKLGFCHAPKEYFDNALEYMAKKFPHSVFLITSDDIDWCEQNIMPVTALVKGEKKALPMVFSRGKGADIDFGMLTLCNHSIVSVGTFGWWGAWFANGHVVYYKDFPLPGTKIDYELNKKDFFPPHWVALSNVNCAKPFLLVNVLMFLITYVLSKMFY